MDKKQHENGQIKKINVFEIVLALFIIIMIVLVILL